MAFLGTPLSALPDSTEGIGQAIELLLPAVLSEMKTQVDGEIERQALGDASRTPTPTEEVSCSCGTCGSTCCD